jgi:hypothetical protein
LKLDFIIFIFVLFYIKLSWSYHLDFEFNELTLVVLSIYIYTHTSLNIKFAYFGLRANLGFFILFLVEYFSQFHYETFGWLEIRFFFHEIIMILLPRS